MFGKRHLLRHTKTPPLRARCLHARSGVNKCKKPALKSAFGEGFGARTEFSGVFAYASDFINARVRSCISSATQPCERLRSSEAAHSRRPFGVIFSPDSIFSSSRGSIISRLSREVFAACAVATSSASRWGARARAIRASARGVGLWSVLVISVFFLERGEVSPTPSVSSPKHHQGDPVCVRDGVIT